VIESFPVAVPPGSGIRERTKEGTRLRGSEAGSGRTPNLIAGMVLPGGVTGSTRPPGPGIQGRTPFRTGGRLAGVMIRNRGQKGKPERSPGPPPSRPTAAPSRRLARVAFPVLLLATLFPLWVAVQRIRYPLSDDALITLTYAKCLAGGLGFVYNQPPAFLGTTTPLLTLILAGLAKVFPFIGLPALAVFFTAACWAAIPWIFYAFRRWWSLEAWHAAVIALVIDVSGWVTYLGMEAYLFAFLLVLSLSLFRRGLPFLAGGATGLLFLTRGEGSLLLPLLMAGTVSIRWWRTRRLAWADLMPSVRVLAGFLLFVLPWGVYAHQTFGQVLPNTLAAKIAQMQSGLGHPFLHRLFFQWVPRWGAGFGPGKIPFLNGWWILVGLGLVEAVRRRREWLYFLLWALLYIAGYGLLRVSSYGWYELPVRFVMNLYAAIGAFTIAETLLVRVPRPFAGAASVLVLGVVTFWSARPTVQAAADPRISPKLAAYERISDWFNDHTRPSESIAYIEIGTLGFHTRNAIVDLYGLITPDITPHLAERDLAWGFWRHAPDYYLYWPPFDWALGKIRSDPRFDREYAPVAHLEFPNLPGFEIFRRR
jgi:arabinofuranosyltransferase